MPDRSIDVPAGECPLCAGDNRCGLVAGHTTCWCFEARIPAAAIDRVPPEARNRSCICQACATAAVSWSAASGAAVDR